MYINKYTNEMSGEKIRGIGRIEVPNGATFATGTTFDGDFVWRRDRYYMNKKETWVETSISLGNLEMFTNIKLMWIHPDVKQKMLEGEIPNQITEKEWMKFYYSKLIGCVINYCGEDVVIKSFNKIIPNIGFDIIYIEDESLGTIGQKRDKVLNNCYFYLEDGTMVSFEEYKGVYYND